MTAVVGGGGTGGQKLPVKGAAGGDVVQQTVVGADGFDAEEYQLRKRLPPRMAKRRNDVYVTTRTNFAAQMARCQRLLDGGLEVYVHGMGAAINRALNLSLQLKRRAMTSVELDVNTSTIEITDDLIPLLDDLHPRASSRRVSTIHIRVFRPEVPTDSY